MSHASRREGAADVPPGYKEEPAPVADDLVSELPWRCSTILPSILPSIHPALHPSIHPSSKAFVFVACYSTSLHRLAAAAPGLRAASSLRSTPLVGRPIPVRLAKRRVSGFMVCPLTCAGPRFLPPPLLP